MNHGHVFPNPDGTRARCGGPGICGECSKDLAMKHAEDLDRALANQKLHVVTDLVRCRLFPRSAEARAVVRIAIENTEYFAASRVGASYP